MSLAYHFSKTVTCVMFTGDGAELPDGRGVITAGGRVSVASKGEVRDSVWR